MSAVRAAPGSLHRELIDLRLHRKIHAVTANTTLTPLAMHLLALPTQVSTELADRWPTTPF